MIDQSAPAFPVADLSKTQCSGMTIRDYMAIHAPNMDCADICNIMDWEPSLPVGGTEDEESAAWQDSVWTRWRELPMKTRIAADVKFRLTWADAMLAARSK